MKSTGTIEFRNGRSIDLGNDAEIRACDLTLWFSGAQGFRLEHEQSGPGKPEDVISKDFNVRLRDGDGISVDLYLGIDQARAVRDVLGNYVAAREALLRLRAE